MLHQYGQREKHRVTLASVQRRTALIVCYVYRMVSSKAVLVIADLLPIDLLAEERSMATTEDIAAELANRNDE